MLIGFEVDYGMHGKRVLFLTTMLPARGRHGGRQAVYNHLRSLIESWQSVSVDLVIVDIDNSGESLPSDIPVDNYWQFEREFPGWTNMNGKLAAIFQFFLELRPRVAAMVYSKKAKKWLQERLNDQVYDVIVLEHANGWVLLKGLKHDVPLTYIAQNIESEIARDELAQQKRFSAHYFRLFVEYFKIARYEESLLRAAHKVLCISSYDAERLSLRKLQATVLAWPELPQLRHVDTRDWSGRRLLFVGSPGHFPNVEAARWLACELMPAIRRLCANVQLHIVGCASADISDGTARDGVIFEGFVSRERLDELHRTSQVFVCPVVLGSGVKIKVLEAVAYGLPIVASNESLRGIDFLLGNALEISRDVSDSATRIVNLLSHPNLMQRMSEGGQIALRNAISKRPPLAEII